MALEILPITNIKHLIPQKTPFVMVDSLLDFSDTKVVSSFKVSDTDLFFSNNKLLESGVIENMAQTVALHTGYDYYLKGEEAPTGYIGSIKKVEIFELPKLDDVIVTEVNILHEFNGVTMVEAKVFNSDKTEIASAQMKTVIA